MPNSLVVAGLVAWSWAIASFFVSPESLPAQAGRLFFWIMVMSHSIEFIVCYGMLKRAPGSLREHFGKTFFVGFFHILQVWQGTKNSHSTT